MSNTKYLGTRDLSNREMQIITSLFNKYFEPILSKSGFQLVGNTWFRICNNYCLQLIRLCYGSSDQDDIQVCAAIKPLCDNNAHWFLQEMSLLPLQQELCDIVYDSCCQHQFKRRVVCSPDNCTGTFRPVKLRIYRSAYYAREYENPPETYILQEFELFRTITLPLMDKLTTPQEYIKHCYQCAERHLARTYSCETFRHSALWAHDWNAAEYATMLLSLENNLIIKDAEIDKLCTSHLKNIRVADSHWVSTLIDPIVKENLLMINQLAQLAHSKA